VQQASLEKYARVKAGSVSVSLSSRDMPVATKVFRSSTSLSSRMPAGRYETVLCRLWEFGGFKYLLPFNFPIVI